MEQKTTKNRLESLKSFKDRILSEAESQAICGGAIDVDTADPHGVIHCDHLDLATGDFGPDLKVDQISYKI